MSYDESAKKGELNYHDLEPPDRRIVSVHDPSLFARCDLKEGWAKKDENQFRLCIRGRSECHPFDFVLTPKARSIISAAMARPFLLAGK